MFQMQQICHHIPVTLMVGILLNSSVMDLENRISYWLHSVKSQLLHVDLEFELRAFTVCYTVLFTEMNQPKNEIISSALVCLVLNFLSLSYSECHQYQSISSQCFSTYQQNMLLVDCAVKTVASMSEKCNEELCFI